MNRRRELSEIELGFIAQARRLPGITGHACDALADLAVLSGHDVGEVLALAVDRLAISAGLENEDGERTEDAGVTIEELG